MRAIPSNNAGPQWDNKLLNDLQFIKRKLRYPLSKKTLPSLFAILLVVVAVSRFLLPVVLIKDTNSPVSWIFMTFGVCFIILTFYRYLRSLKFAVIQTPFAADENRKLVDKFLRWQQLALFNHPQAPEVFQIISTPIGDPSKDQREVMIFIADDNRILINSHFTNQKLALTLSSGNYRQMAARLKEWVRKQYPDRQFIAN